VKKREERGGEGEDGLRKDFDFEMDFCRGCGVRE
jgi:hypothetical protein